MFISWELLRLLCLYSFVWSIILLLSQKQQNDGCACQFVIKTETMKLNNFSLFKISNETNNKLKFYDFDNDFLCYVFNDIQYNGGDVGGDYFTLLLEKFSGHSLVQRTFYSIEDIIDTKRLFCLWLLHYNGSIYKLQRNSIGCLCVVAPSQSMKMNGCPLYSVVFFNWTLLNLFRSSCRQILHKDKQWHKDKWFTTMKITFQFV